MRGEFWLAVELKVHGTYSEIKCLFGKIAHFLDQEISKIPRNAGEGSAEGKHPSCPYLRGARGKSALSMQP